MINPQDDTVIPFDLAGLHEMKSLLELSNDFNNDYFHMGTDTHYLKTNLYQRMFDKVRYRREKEKDTRLVSSLG